MKKCDVRVKWKIRKAGIKNKCVKGKNNRIKKHLGFPSLNLLYASGLKSNSETALKSIIGE